ncbi:MAG: internal scaffolding protein [Arizlama microvirus]|nr:MAG: internal scaffolding protein [Arizlama microvirus]
MNHTERQAKGRTTNNEPTLTDQSGAAETDLNVILKRYSQSGTIQSHGKEPMYEDWTQYPEDFRGYLHTAMEAKRLRAALPDKLQNLKDHELLALTPEQLETILAPPAKPADTPKDEPK